MMVWNGIDCDKAVFCINKEIYEHENSHYQCFYQYILNNQKLIYSLNTNHKLKDYDWYYDFCCDILFKILKQKPLFLFIIHKKLVIKNCKNLTKTNLETIQHYSKKHELVICILTCNNTIVSIEEFN